MKFQPSPAAVPLILTGFLFSAGAYPADGTDDPPLREMGFEQLLEMEVSTVARKEQSLAQTPAAAYVVTAEDIRRSGATSIPEALRMVPGVNVAQISPSKWSVSIRGFGSRYASKLLVLIDGRSVYTPTFSGVYWEFESVPIEEIERIEVIRGPGATLWGANAVNGIVNILTRHASTTHGGLADLRAGDRQTIGTLRWGGPLGETGNYRVFAHGEDQQGFNPLDGSNESGDFDRRQVGFRADWYGDASEQFGLQGDVQRLRQDSIDATVDLTNPPTYTSRKATQTETKAANLVARWERALAADSEIRVQGYLDYYDRVMQNGYGCENVYTFDLDLQHRYGGIPGHEIVWGLGYRRFTSDIDNSDLVSTVPERRTGNLFSLFAQDEYELLDDRLWLTLGTKFEHNDFTDWETQPNLRALWVPDPDQTIWASIARAVRTPSRGERDANAVIGVVAPSPRVPLPILLQTTANPEFQSEELVAYELGYRARLTPGLGLDIVAFYNDYDRLLSARRGQPIPAPDYSHLTLPLLVVNDLEGETYGAELFLNWNPAPRWRVVPALSLLRTNLRSKSHGDAAQDVVGEEEEDPQLQLSLRLGWSPEPDLDLDLWLRHVSAIVKDEVPVDAYTELDLRVGWRPVPDLELALTGKNLLHPQHLEYLDTVFPIPLEIPRSVMVSLSYAF